MTSKNSDVCYASLNLEHYSSLLTGKESKWKNIDVIMFRGNCLLVQTLFQLSLLPKGSLERIGLKQMRLEDTTVPDLCPFQAHGCYQALHTPSLRTRDILDTVLMTKGTLALSLGDMG